MSTSDDDHNHEALNPGVEETNLSSTRTNEKVVQFRRKNRDDKHQQASEPEPPDGYDPGPSAA